MSESGTIYFRVLYKGETARRPVMATLGPCLDASKKLILELVSNVVPPSCTAASCNGTVGHSLWYHEQLLISTSDIGNAMIEILDIWLKLRPESKLHRPLFDWLVVKETSHSWLRALA